MEKELLQIKKDFYTYKTIWDSKLGWIDIERKHTTKRILKLNKTI